VVTRLKYTVLGFQQEKLIENGLCMNDALILRTIKDMYSSASMEFKDFDGIKYVWINYTYLAKQIPIIGKKRYLMSRIESYGKEHLLLRVLEKTRHGQKGNFSYVSPTEKLDNLQDYDPYAQNAQGGLCTERTSLTHESHNKDTSISDTSINKIPYVEIVDYLNLQTKSSYRSSGNSIRTLIHARWEDGYRLDNFKKVIDNKVSSWTGTEHEKYLRPETLFGTKFDSYLNEKGSSIKKSTSPLQGEDARAMLRRQREELKSREDVKS